MAFQQVLYNGEWELYCTNTVTSTICSIIGVASILDLRWLEKDIRWMNIQKDKWIQQLPDSFKFMIKWRRPNKHL